MPLHARQTQWKIAATFLFAVTISCRSSHPIPLLDLKSNQGFAPIANLAWFEYRRDFGTVPTWEHLGASQSKTAMTKAFRKLKQAGVQGVVWFLLADGGAAPGFDSAGEIVGLDSTFIADFKAGIAIAEENEMSVVWVLLDHLWLKPAETSGAAQLFGHARLMDDPRQQTVFLEKVLDPIISIGSRSRSTAGWIVMNEPEVALGEGWTTEQKLFPFLSKVVARVIEKHSDASVSISHADVESLVNFQTEYPQTAINFLNFHHYRNYMPPSAERVLQSIAGRRLPLYIGEFSWNDKTLQRPFGDLRSIVGGSLQLGYSGIWPWAIDPKHNPAKQVDQYVDAVLHASKMQPVSMDSPAGATRQIETWKAEMKDHDLQIALNSKKLSETRNLLNKLEADLQMQTAELEKAREAHGRLVHSLDASRAKIAKLRWLPWAGKDLALEQANEKQLMERMNGKQWLQQAQETFQKAQAQVLEQRNWSSQYEMRVRGNQFQLKAKQHHIPIARRLYDLP